MLKALRKRRRLRLSRFRFGALAFLAVLGPGFITANVDNDPGGILQYSQAGAMFGYKLLWALIPTTVALIFVQEMAARMGAITGKGLSDLIREEFGLRATFFTLALLGLADVTTLSAEFAGIASGLGIFHISKYFTVPLGAAIVWLVVVRGSYKPVERLLLLLSLMYFAYPVAAYLAHPDWHAALTQTFVPSIIHNSDYVIVVVGLIGTTITPWMQFYLQASIVEKGITEREYRLSRWDVVVGCIITDVVAFFIVVSCGATLYKNGVHDIKDAAEAAQALIPLAGRFAGLLFAVGLVNAAMLSAAILPLATAYNVCEGMGFESGVDKKFSEAPVFYWLYTALIVFGAGVVLIPRLPLIKLILFSNVANGVLLPFVLFFMLKLVNRHEIMGKYVNSRLTNVVVIGISVIMVALTMVLLWTSLTGH